MHFPPPARWAWSGSVRTPSRARKGSRTMAVSTHDGFASSNSTIRHFLLSPLSRLVLRRSGAMRRYDRRAIRPGGNYRQGRARAAGINRSGTVSGFQTYPAGGRMAQLAVTIAIGFSGTTTAPSGLATRVVGQVAEKAEQTSLPRDDARGFSDNTTGRGSSSGNPREMNFLGQYRPPNQLRGFGFNSTGARCP